MDLKRRDCKIKQNRSENFIKYYNDKYNRIIKISTGFDCEASAFFVHINH